MAFWIVDISRSRFLVHSCSTYGRNERESDGIRIGGDRPMKPVGAKQQIFLKTYWFESLE